MKSFSLLVLFFLFSGICFSQTQEMPKMPTMPRMPSLQQPQQRQPVEVQITVNAGKIWSTPFVINQDNTKYKVDFDVADERDIVVFIADSNNFKRFIDERKFSVFYQSGKVEEGNIDLTLPRGTYFLVVSNKHAMFWSKKVFLTLY